MYDYPCTRSLDCGRLVSPSLHKMIELVGKTIRLADSSSIVGVDTTDFTFSFKNVIPNMYLLFLHCIIKELELRTL